MRKPSFYEFRKWLWDWSYFLLAPWVTLLLVAALCQTLPYKQLEFLTVNARFQARAPFDPPADPRVMLVGIDQQSLDLLGRFPWPRTVEGDFLKTLANAQANPRTVAFDIIFTEKSAAASDDSAFADAAGNLPSVITGALSIIPFLDNPAKEAQSEEETRADAAQLGMTRPLPHVHGDVGRIYGSNVARFPILPLRQQSLFAFINDDASGIDAIRHTLPFVVRVGDKVYPSLSLQTLCQLLGVDPEGVVVDLGRQVTLRNGSGKMWTVPIDERGSIFINYRRESSYRGTSFVHLTQVLQQHAADPAKYPIPPESDVAKAALLIGTTAIGTTDLGPTPLQPHSPLVYTHLNVINSVLRQDFISLVPWPEVVCGWLAVTWITLWRLRRARLTVAVIAPVAIAAVYILGAFFLFWWRSILIEIAWPILAYTGVNFGLVVLRWREEQRGREQIKSVFARMLSPQVLGHLMAHPENLKLGGSDRGVTILFSDIRDYTGFSEGLTAAEVVRQLNLYFERMVPCVQEFSGTFHKYIGDAVMAVWGDIADASQGPRKDAQNAVRAALRMRRELARLNTERTADGLVPLRIGIGLNHGEVLVGLIGATSRSEFTVMGDAVNTASRLEGMTKVFHTDLAISESVRDLLEDRFLLRRLGLIQLKGKTTAALVFEVLAELQEIEHSRFSAEFVVSYEKGFDAFFQRRFAEAEHDFLICAREHPEDYCVKTYLEASSRFLRNPPDPDWDGRMVMESK